ncbi:MAG TPA: hypothetical protein VHG28_10465 [Longimicrobiaceae bacterium]|nr:hypothetical protein [Longimicrobiaceae bacterium]
MNITPDLTSIQSLVLIAVILVIWVAAGLLQFDDKRHKNRRHAVVDGTRQFVQREILWRALFAMLAMLALSTGLPKKVMNLFPSGRDDTTVIPGRTDPPDEATSKNWPRMPLAIPVPSWRVRAPDCPPIETGLVIDRSGSIDTSGAEKPDTQNLKPFAELLKRCGGKLWVSIVGGGKRATGVGIPAPPLPADRSYIEDHDWTIGRIREEHARLDAEDSLAHTQWALAAQDSMNRFWTRLEGLLEAPVDRSRSPICDAVCDMDHDLLGHDPEVRRENPRWMVLISDGNDNVRSGSCEPVREPTRVVLVKNNDDPADLSRLRPVIVHSIQEAADTILSGSVRAPRSPWQRLWSTSRIRIRSLIGPHCPRDRT